MPFKKGHKGMGGGRKKGTKHGEGKNKNASMDIARYSPKQWERNATGRTFDIDEVDYYLYNDLDITELMDAKKLPAYEWKSGSEKKRQYNLNSQMKAKRDKENGE